MKNLRIKILFISFLLLVATSSLLPTVKVPPVSKKKESFVRSIAPEVALMLLVAPGREPGEISKVVVGIAGGIAEKIESGVIGSVAVVMALAIKLKPRLKW